MTMRLLGGLSAKDFLRRHWQKRPLFAARAFADPRLIEPAALAALARRDDVESRIVERRGNSWNVTHGPFPEKISPKPRNWTLLVSGVNLHVPAADDLLRRFSFVPQARLDDLMVSYATPGGGVGPHVDSYDVFLLQGPGRRRWTVEGKTYVAKPGDLLYLPPGLEHDGVALDPCFTYSVGFRAPRGAELGAAFLDWLHERGLPDATYRDPGLAATRHPGRIPPELIDFAHGVLKRIRWNRNDAASFLGEYLSAPKQHVVFRPSGRRRELRRALVRLEGKTQLLYSGRRFFINGERFHAPHGGARLLRELADRRRADGAALARSPLAGLISEWNRRGYLRLEAPR
jgi:50S ribosomal protein L16 3-hydroxylase